MPKSPDDSTASREVLRKGLHVIVALFPLLMLRIGKATSVAILLTATVAALVAEFLRSRNSRVESFIIRIFGRMMRPDEHAAGRVSLNGATWVLLSLTFLTLLFDLRIAAAAFMMFMIADAAAALVGTAAGRHKWPWSSRTLEGSAAFGVCSFLIGTLVGDFLLVTIVLATLVGVIMESLPGPLNDNFRVPVCMALTLLLDTYLM